MMKKEGDANWFAYIKCPEVLGGVENECVVIVMRGDLVADDVVEKLVEVVIPRNQFA